MTRGDEGVSVAVGESKIHGKGLFAVEEIPWGVKIIEYQLTIPPSAPDPRGRESH